MKKRLYLYSSGLVILCVLLFISYTRISKATTLINAGSESETGGRQILSDSETDARIQAFGKNVSSWLNGNTGGLVPSVAVGVIRGEKLVYHHGANADSTTRFGIASLSKTFTAVLALRLHEKKILSLEDPVKKYLPTVVIEREELNSSPVTLRQLLAHTSGIPSFGKWISYNINGKAVSVPEQVHPAGLSYSYSNEGYVLMMHAIEAATGKSYAENIKEHILDPLEMSDSTAEFSNGTGGIVTTIRDLAKYAAMLINSGKYRGRVFLGEQSFREMLANPVEHPRTSADYYYSLSWEVITVGNEIDSYYKAGRWYNQASGLQVFPKRKIAFIYLCNPPQHLNENFMAWRQGLTGMLRFLVRKISGDESLCTVWPSLSAQELKWYEGNYRNVITGQKVQVSLKGGVLYSNGFGAFMPLRTFTANRFLIDEGRMLHNFVWKDHRVVGLALRNGYFETVHQ